MSVSQKDPAFTTACEVLAGTGGTQVYTATSTGEPYWCWRARGWRAVSKVLPRIAPLLIVKHDRAAGLLAVMASYDLLMQAPLIDPRGAPRGRRRLANRVTADVMKALLPWLEAYQPGTKALAACRAALAEAGS